MLKVTKEVGQKFVDALRAMYQLALDHPEVVMAEEEDWEDQQQVAVINSIKAGVDAL